jgi:raffinose/stachyose/melibiose transport system permease protein
MQDSNKLKKQGGKLIAELLMIAITLLFLYPFFIMVFVSFKSAREALVSPNTFPSEFHFENYLEVWKIMHFMTPLTNSLIVTSLGVLGIVVFAGMAGFIIAKSKTKICKFLFLFFVAGIMVPFYTSLVPLVKLMSSMDLINSRMGLVLYYWGRGMPMAVFLYTGFIRGVSNEIIESAVIDGAGKWKIYWQIVFPMLKPITTTIIILDSLMFWNNYLMPSLILTKEKIRTIPLSQYHFYGEYGTQWQLAFAAYVIAMVPVIILYIFCQKNIIKGIASGAVKG